MTRFNWKTRRRIASIIGAVLIAAAPVSAQELDTSLGVEPLALLQDGRIVVRNGEQAFDCALVAGAETVTLGDCRQVVSGGRMWSRSCQI